MKWDEGPFHYVSDFGPLFVSAGQASVHMQGRESKRLELNYGGMMTLWNGLDWEHVGYARGSADQQARTLLETAHRCQRHGSL